MKRPKPRRPKRHKGKRRKKILDLAPDIDVDEAGNADDIFMRS